MASGKRKHAEDGHLSGHDKAKKIKLGKASPGKQQFANTTSEPKETSVSDRKTNKQKKKEKKKEKIPKDSLPKVKDSADGNKETESQQNGKKTSKHLNKWQRYKKKQKPQSGTPKQVPKKVPKPASRGETGKKDAISTNTTPRTSGVAIVTGKPHFPIPAKIPSSNWKKLQVDIQKTAPKKTNPKKHLKKRKSTEPAPQEESEKPDIWFDDVDEELIHPTEEKPKNNVKTASRLSRPSQSAGGLVKENSFKGVTKAVALDCEMVGVGDSGKESVLARVSVVNQFGECLYDTFVRSREEVVDYRTQWSGVTPDKLVHAADFMDVQKKVSDLISGRILVGHAIQNDLKVLFLDHPAKDIRDTSRYKPYRQLFRGRTPSLKNLTSRLLSVKIQTGEHNSVTDAQATMRLYTLSRQAWEKDLMNRRKHRRPLKKKKKINDK
ncbi:RNA exonuclease 4-like [Haliotis rufescens]|uniref:RNA exonuclease 4-like n=1 Tax=Haliotis rufescens TaxID=6454 RepID=UPI00201F2597|nr:RNA exonuclease 4-like [Haliotis rufescens]